MLRRKDLEPAVARFDANLGEFLLPYEAVRIATDPEATLLQFLQSTYRAAAETGEWNHGALECAFGRLAAPRPILVPE
ncbi:MAG TPA: DUF5996 family protein [Pseudolabrys sp.]|nr:DUF5996 family protein [Pseudolabrys sp.]